MASPSSEKELLQDTRRAIRELIQAREFGGRVESLLRKREDDPETSALMDVVMGSISRALSSLEPYSNDHRYKFSGDRKKGSCPSGEKRGGFRRRIPPSPVRHVTANTATDGYVWRKYGQKQIQGAVHQRSYYRCLHKYDQGCLAQKQVQKSEEDPSLLLITYQGEHTCKEPAAPASSSLKEESLISFGLRGACGSSQDLPLLSTSFPLPVHSSLDGSASMVMEFSSSEYCDMNVGLSEGSTSTPGAQTGESACDVGEATLGVESIDSFDMGFMNDSFDYMEEVFRFEEGDEFFRLDGKPAGTW